MNHFGLSRETKTRGKLTYIIGDKATIIDGWFSLCDRPDGGINVTCRKYRGRNWFQLCNIENVVRFAAALPTKTRRTAY